MSCNCDTVQLQVVAGCSLVLELQCREDDGTTAINLTGYTAAMQARLTPDSAPVIDITDADDITISAVAGNVTISTSTAGIDPGTYLFDVVITSSGALKYSIVRGTIEILKAVTQ